MNIDPKSYTAPSIENWHLTTTYDLDRMYKRLDQLENELPPEYAEYVMNAIKDIESINRAIQYREFPL